MSDTQHTADKLRDRAALEQNSDGSKFVVSMLRAGADAMEDLKIAIQAGTEVEGELAKAEARAAECEKAWSEAEGKLSYAEARVKELVVTIDAVLEHVDKQSFREAFIHLHSFNAALLRLKDARAALQVKP